MEANFVENDRSQSFFIYTEKNWRNFFMTINSSATMYSPLSAEKLALAKEHRAYQKWSALFRTEFFGNCDVERATANEMRRDMRNSDDFNSRPSEAWQTATGLRVLTCEDWEKFLQDSMTWYLGVNPNKNAFTVPRTPNFNLRNLAFNFNAETNTINIGIGSIIHMDGYFLEVLENTVVARYYDGSFSEKGASSAVALNSLLRGLGVDASWGYDEHTKQTTMNFLQKLGVDTSRPFFINGTQFEVQGDKLRTVGETTPQDLQFWGFEGLNRLVARAYALNLFNPTCN
jgi:hypothetical protein